MKRCLDELSNKPNHDTYHCSSAWLVSLSLLTAADPSPSACFGLWSNTTASPSSKRGAINANPIKDMAKCSKFSSWSNFRPKYVFFANYINETFQLSNNSTTHRERLTPTHCPGMAWICRGPSWQRAS